MSDNFKKFLTISAVTITSMHCINRLIDYTSTSKNLLDDSKGKFYPSKQGNIFYTKYGKGSPVILIHDFHPASSGVEWDKIIRKLRRDHTVYTLDLLGCGRSDKPWITYTNYMYVQILNEFIENVIKNPTDIVATGQSGSFAIMAKAFQNNLIKKIVLVNPVSLSSCKEPNNEISKAVKYALELPIIGTSLYNLIMNRENIHGLFTEKYYFHKSLVSSKLENVYVESAHKSKSAGRYLLASMHGSYMYADISKAIRSMENIYIISSREEKENVSITNGYLKQNKNIEVTHISNSKYLPQQEVPEKFYDALSMFLES